MPPPVTTTKTRNGVTVYRKVTERIVMTKTINVEHGPPGESASPTASLWTRGVRAAVECVHGEGTQEEWRACFPSSIKTKSERSVSQHTEKDGALQPVIMICRRSGEIVIKKVRGLLSIASTDNGDITVLTVISQRS